MARLAAVTAFIALIVLAVVCLSRVGDPPETIIEFVPAAAPGCPRVPGRNPCAVVNCNRGDTRRIA